MSLFRKKAEDKQQSFTSQRRLILNKNSSFVIQEAYKSLRTNIRFSLHDSGCKRICLTSGMASEGKSTTILNLAISFAETGSRVLLIDGDMRRPSQAKLLVQRGTPGLSNVLAGLTSLEEAVRTDVRPNLDVLFSGEIPPNPLELLGNAQMKQMLDTLSERYEYILIDTPPVGIVSDACEVACLTHGVLFLVRQGETDKDVVQRCVKQLEFANGKILGFVLNDAGGKGSRRYGGYKYSKYYRYKYYKTYAYRQRSGK